MTDDSELEQRLRRDLAELGAVPEAKERERKVVRRRPPGATLMVALAVVLALVGASFAIVRSSDHPRRQEIGSNTTRPTATSSTTRPTTTTATPVPEPPPPTCCTTPNDKGILQQFAPTSASAWWAILGDGSVVRTVDAGATWSDVSPPTSVVPYAAFFLNRDVGWVLVGDPTIAAQHQRVMRTLDGGQSWLPGGTVPSGCTLQFLDPVHGWCTFIGGALGSASVDLVRTSDGGSTWTLVSRTDVEPSASTPGSLPFGGEKTINFTSLSVGWAPFYNAGDVRRGSVYKSDDGGSRWHELPPVPFPAGAPDPSGSGLGAPVVQGSGVAMVLTIGGRPGATAIVTSSNGGGSWRSQMIPGANRYWNVALADPVHWRATDGTVFIATDDAGAHWRTSTPAIALKDSLGGVHTLKFLSPSLGWAVPTPNGGRLWWTTDGGLTWKPVTIGR